MNISKITERLAELIDTEGSECTRLEPYRVYEVLINEEICSLEIAAGILYTLVMDIPACAESMTDRKQLSKVIGETCSLKKPMADLLADIYLNLHSVQRKEEREKKVYDGCQSFLRKEQEYVWEGNCAWGDEFVYAPCIYRASVILRADTPNANSMFSAMLEQNPCIPEKEIYDFFLKDLKRYLDKKFEWWCTCDDDPPASEDFDAEAYVEDWCCNNGFRMIEFDGDGYTGNYERY